MTNPPRIVLGVTAAQSLKLMTGMPDHLRATGWDVHIVVGEQPVETTTDSAVHVVPMKREPSLLSDLRSLVSMYLLLRRVKPDVVAFGTPKAALVGILSSRLARVRRRIYVMRGLRAETAAGGMRRLLLSIEKLTMWASTDVLCVSRSLAERVTELGLTAAGRVHVLGHGSSNGVDTSRFREATLDERHAARTELGLPNGSTVIGFVGRITPDKGVADLVEAAGSLGEEVRLLVIGAEESSGYTDRLVERARDLRLPLHVAGARSDVTACYHAMDIFCLPSRREGFPNVVLEASASGLPVVTSDATGCRDAVIHNKTGYIAKVGDVHGLATCLSDLVNNSDQRHRMGATGRQWVAENFERRSVWVAHAAHFQQADAQTRLSVGADA